MSNIVLTGQVPVEINHTFAVTCSRMSVSKSTPTQVIKGPFGPIGTRQGIADVTGTLTFPVPVSSLEFDFDTLSGTPGGFTVSYSLGATKYALVGCHVNSDAFDNDPGAGNADNTIGFTATERILL